ncbi:hypothetical protein S40288_04057 [Stachybotrys chartarum IBT 40288]|nr:hypothetical protein S40288_04057 [Stachybotrys chartarum IBT 40288]
MGRSQFRASSRSSAISSKAESRHTPRRRDTRSSATSGGSISRSFTPTRGRSNASFTRASGRPNASSTSCLGSVSSEPTAQAVHNLASAPSPPLAVELDADGCLEEIIMAIDLGDNQTIGCATFSTVNGTLSLMDEIAMADSILYDQVITHLQPTTVLASARAPESLLQRLEARAEHSQNESNSANFILRFLQSSEFSYDAACERLVGLEACTQTDVQAVFAASGTDAVNDDLEMVLGRSVVSEASKFKLMRCGALVNLENSVSIGCAGAVLAEVHRRRSASFLPDGGYMEIQFQVGRVTTFSVSNYMHIDAETLSSLQILQSEPHPNSQVWGLDPNGSGTKESLSVYGLFHHFACTPQGRISLKKLFLRPTLDLSVIEERQRTIAVMLKPRNVEGLRLAVGALRKIDNIRAACTQLRKGATLRRFAVQALKLRECIITQFASEDHVIFRKIVHDIRSPELMSVGDMINKTIDFEQSKERQRPSVRMGVDARLDELKRRYDGMGNFLTTIVHHVNRHLPEWASHYVKSCMFLPQLGFLMAVEADPVIGTTRFESEEIGDDMWEKVFTSDNVDCYKNKYMRELDAQYGDMYCEIGGNCELAEVSKDSLINSRLDMEVELTHELATDVLKHEEMLVSASDLCGEFDALLALALGAEKYGWTSPQMVSRSTIHIEGGRHPLQELVVPSFVPNDCDIRGHESPGSHSHENGQAIILTGPNHSGKSIYLKQTAIIVYLAHIGSFVPADKAVVGITDKILTRISTRESMVRAESAFAIDLRQVAQAMKTLTSRSLIIIDEFGKGTNTDDGIGLMGALIDYLSSFGEGMPRLLLATHFHELIEGGYLDEYPMLSHHHMDVRTDNDGNQLEKEIIYLFKITLGPSSASFGGRCAALNGVPTEVVARAETLSLLLARNEDLSSACAKLSDSEKQRLEVAESVARQFVQADLSEDSHDGTSTEKGGLAMKTLLRKWMST